MCKGCGNEGKASAVTYMPQEKLGRCSPCIRASLIMTGLTWWIHFASTWSLQKGAFFWIALLLTLLSFAHICVWLFNALFSPSEKAKGDKLPDRSPRETHEFRYNGEQDADYI